MTDEERQKYKEAKNKRNMDRYNKVTDEKKQKNKKKKYRDLPEEQKQKRRDYQNQYTENMTDEQK